MSVVTVTRASASPPGQVWAALTRFPAYGSALPLTTVRTDPGRPRLGWSFTGLTGLGPLRFADSMLLTAWEPPCSDRPGGRFRVVKTGRLLDGWAEATVTPAATGSLVTWTEEILLRPWPFRRVSGPLLAPLTARLFGRALDRLLADAGRADADPAGAAP